MDSGVLTSVGLNREATMLKDTEWNFKSILSSEVHTDAPSDEAGTNPSFGGIAWRNGRHTTCGVAYEDLYKQIEAA